MLVADTTSYFCLFYLSFFKMLGCAVVKSLELAFYEKLGVHC